MHKLISSATIKTFATNHSKASSKDSENQKKDLQSKIALSCLAFISLNLSRIC